MRGNYGNHIGIALALNNRRAALQGATHRRSDMRAFLATVLSVIAVGVMLIAYGLFSPRIATAGNSPLQTARPLLASERVGLVEEGFAPSAQYVNYPAAAYSTARPPMAYPVNEVRAVPAVYETSAPTPQRVVYRERPTARAVATRVERAPARDWKKSAMVIGGTTAAGAGVGAIFGGRKGALIGAAIGGGAGTIYEVRKR
jgi:hypothetical protein